MNPVSQKEDLTVLPKNWGHLVQEVKKCGGHLIRIGLDDYKPYLGEVTRLSNAINWLNKAVERLQPPQGGKHLRDDVIAVVMPHIEFCKVITACLTQTDSAWIKMVAAEGNESFLHIKDILKKELPVMCSSTKKHFEASFVDLQRVLACYHNLANQRPHAKT